MDGTCAPVPAGMCDPPSNITFDTNAMGCFKAVVIDDVTHAVVWGSATGAACPTELADIYLPPTGYTLIVWVKDPPNQLLAFDSPSTFAMMQARCSTYATAPTSAQLSSDQTSQTFSAVTNGGTAPAYMFTQSCPADAEYWIHP
jgi:hypothetical protein